MDPTKDDLLEAAWGIIANTYGGDWELASDDWKDAAERWRDNYHAIRVFKGDAMEQPIEGSIL